MITKIEHRGRNDGLLLWFACVLALAAGLSIAYFRLEFAIDAQHEQTAALAAVARTNEQTRAERGQLERTEGHINESLRALDLDADHPTAVIRFIREAARLATIDHTNLVQIDEGHLEATDVRSSRLSLEADPLESLPLDVTLSGSYRDLIATIRDLSQAPIALDIEIAAIERATSDTATASAGPLTARLRVRVAHLRAGTPPPPSAATSSPQEKSDARSR